MSELRRRMVESLELRGLAPLTQKTYLQCLTNLARNYMRSPADLSDEQIRQFFVGLRQRKLSEGSFRTHRYAVQFLAQNPVSGTSN